MAASNSVHSTALNFLSCLQSGVDPRTGLYKIVIDMPEVAANELRGPGFSMGLSYSSLNALDSGYGMGWNLQLSQYTPGDQVLSLSTGETFKVTDSGANGQLLMRDKKLDSFHFYRVDERYFRVVHKSGLVEILELLDVQSRIALPTKIYAASGHGITLAYKPFGAGHMMLSSIEDSSGQVLLSVVRDPGAAQIEFLLQPFAGPDGGPLARFVMILQGTARQVARIILPTDNQASWRFVYGQFDDHLCITGVDSPLGGHEDIFYQDTGHQFPIGSGRRPLPRVTRHLADPGLGQPKVDVRYSYPGNHNFLGGGLSIPWVEDGYDNLFKYLAEYEYICQETLWVDDQPVRSIERKFNRFHLQTREVTTQSNNRQTIETRYAYEPGKPYSEQPNDCQLPIEVKTSWTLLDEPTRFRSESVTSRYDPYGNLLEQVQANGVVEESIWYPAIGEDGCPPDPEGFVRNLKEKRIIPASVGTGQAPTLSTHFRYRTLPALPDSGSSDWLVPEQETLLDQANPDPALQITRIDYLDIPDNAFLHGRVTRRSVTLNDLTTHTDFDYQRLDDSADGTPTLQITSTLSTDFDDVSSVSIDRESLLTSQLTFREIQGVQTCYTYDALGRLTRETVSPGTTFEANRQYRYVLCANVGEQAEQLQTSAKQVNSRILIDGMGRRIHEEHDHIEAALPSRFKRVYAARFNAWGVLEEETDYDWLQQGTQEMGLATRLEYDDWGQQRCMIGPDNVQSHSVIDPIGTPEFSGPTQRTWQQSADQSEQVSGLEETWLNPFGKQAQVTSLTQDGQPLGTQHWSYDGLGRCVEHHDELDLLTRYEYDLWSRLTRTVLPNQSVLEREYAPHSSAELATELRVSRDGINFSLAGRQQFDGLARMTRLEVGSRVEQFEYDDGHTQVRTRTTAAGVPIEYRYNLALTDQPIDTSAPDSQARFDYDTTSARLTLAGNEQGTREYDYDTANQLRAERWVSGGQRWETSYLSSTQGRLQQRTEQQQSGAGGLQTLYGYDAAGRLETLDQGRLRASFEYDGLGRVHRTTTRDTTIDSALVTELEFDDQGREILRTLLADNQPPHTVEQHWRIDGLLQYRHSRQGSLSLLEETFDYDARGRLSEHLCAGSTLPRDALGRQIVQQIFAFDALDNISTSVTHFADGAMERARYFYDGPDPFQLARIAYTPARATPDPVFSYDLNGNQLQDELGRRLSYDSQSRLREVQSPTGQPVCEYTYDGHDHLVTSSSAGAAQTLRFYQEHVLTSSLQDGAAIQYLHHQDRPLGQQQADDAGRTLLLLTDGNASVIGEAQQQQLRSSVYSAYGEAHALPPMLSLPGFNGEMREAESGWYLLGKGYRAYNPGLMRFHSPDALSPFDAGGINPYSYCLGNPIALRDPTGNTAIGYSGRPRRPDEGVVQGLPSGGGGLMAWVSVAVGAIATAAAIASLVASLGTSAPVAVPLAGSGVAAAGAGVGTISAASVAVAVGSAVFGAGSTALAAAAIVEEDDNLGNAAFWAGIAGLAFAMGGSSLVKGFTSVSKISGTTGRLSRSGSVLSRNSFVPERFKSPLANPGGWGKPPGPWATQRVSDIPRAAAGVKIVARKPGPPVPPKPQRSPSWLDRIVNNEFFKRLHDQQTQLGREDPIVPRIVEAQGLAKQVRL